LKTLLKPTHIEYKAGNFTTLLIGLVSKFLNFCQALCTDKSLDMHLLFRDYFPRMKYDSAFDLMFCSWYDRKLVMEEAAS